VQELLKLTNKDADNQDYKYEEPHDKEEEQDEKPKDKENEAYQEIG